MSRLLGLHELNVGQKAVVYRLCTAGSMRRRLLDIGLAENTVVECVSKSPAGDPIAFFIRGAVIAIRAEDCRTVDIKVLQE